MKQKFREIAQIWSNIFGQDLKTASTGSSIITPILKYFAFLLYQFKNHPSTKKMIQIVVIWILQRDPISQNPNLWIVQQKNIWHQTKMKLRWKMMIKHRPKMRKTWVKLRNIYIVYNTAIPLLTWFPIFVISPKVIFYLVAKNSHKVIWLVRKTKNVNFFL